MILLFYVPWLALQPAVYLLVSNLKAAVGALCR